MSPPPPSVTQPISSTLAPVSRLTYFTDYSYGDEGFGWSPQVSDYKVILEQLKSQDEMIIYEAVMNLQQQLSIAQDNTLSNFAVDQYIAVLIEILKRPPMSDFTNEINSK